MMKLQTEIDIQKTDIVLGVDSRVMFVGSCFAEHVGMEMQKRMGMENVCANPFGVLYNPLSIANALELLVSDDVSLIERQVRESVFQGQDGLWHSWLFTTHFSGKTREDCEAKTLQAVSHGRDFLAHTDLLCVTFGTTRCYRLIDGTVVANCHKEPQKTFTEYEPTMDEMRMLWESVLQKLSAFNPTLRVCYTVSPFRYRKYGFHQSQLQKSKLLLLTDMLKGDYFPSYEIMMDELRDYRFYAADMLHPSDVAVQIITERFMEWTFTDELKKASVENLKQWKRGQHRSLPPHPLPLRGWGVK